MTDEEYRSIVAFAKLVNQNKGKKLDESLLQLIEEINSKLKAFH